MTTGSFLRGAAVFLVLCAPVVARAETSGQQRAETAGRGLVGTPAPRLVVKTIDGDSIDLGSLYGKKAVYLKFWATWCVPCREQMPHFEHAYETAGADLAVIAIDAGFNDSVEEIRRYQERLKITMPVVFDEDGRLGAAFNLRVTPQHIVIGRDGRIQYVGHLADQRLDAALAAARAPVAGSATTTVGGAAAVAALHFGVGDHLPDVAPTTLDGGTFPFRAQGLPGPTVFVFLSPWCETYLATTRPIVAANCRVARQQAAMISRDGRVRLLGVASGLWATPEDLQAYRSTYKIGFPLTLDESAILFREFAVSNTPTIIIADATGTIRRRIEPADAHALRQLLGAL
jgi:peroxiredoxin